MNMKKNEVMDKVENVEEVEGTKEIKHISFEEYKKNDRNNNRKLNKPNSFKSKIYKEIHNSKKEKGELFYNSLHIMFLLNHTNVHKDFLLERMEVESNYFRTYENIEKCKSRCILEMLACKDLGVDIDVKINTNGKKDERRWSVVAKMQYKDITLLTTTSYNRIKKSLKGRQLEFTDEIGDYTMLGDKELNRQQYFEFSLREALNKIDEKIVKLIKIKTDLLNEK